MVTLYSGKENQIEEGYVCNQRNYNKTMFSIFKFEKIDQNGLKLDNQKLFYTKSST